MRWLLAALLAWGAVPGGAACRQALALGLDVSGSVDAQEYHLQTHGLANALQRPEVLEAILAFPGAPVRLMVFEWAGQGSRRVLVPWSDLPDLGAVDAVAAQLLGTSRVPFDPATAIGEAMQFGLGELVQQGDCWKHTLDVSGDGKSNSGPRPRDLPDLVFGQEITVNGLVIGADAPATGDTRQTEINELWAYYKVEVIRGENAFIEVALGFEDFEDAMARKLLRELETLAVSSLD